MAIIQLVTLPPSLILTLSPEVNYIARKRQTNRDQLNTNSVDIHLEGTPMRRMSLDLESLNLPELKVPFCQTPLFVGMSTDTHWTSGMQFSWEHLPYSIQPCALAPLPKPFINSLASFPSFDWRRQRWFLEGPPQSSPWSRACDRVTHVEPQSLRFVTVTRNYSGKLCRPSLAPRPDPCFKVHTYDLNHFIHHWEE